MDTIMVGDLVEERGTDSGWWVVLELYRNTPGNGTAAKLALNHKPTCIAHCPVDRLTRVGSSR